MRCQSGLVCVVAIIAALTTASAWAQGEIQTPAKPASPSLNSMPHWSEFPVPPTNVPKASEIKGRVEVQVALRDQLRRQYGALPWDAFEPDTLAAAMHAKIDPAMLTPVDAPMSASQLESLAAAMRAKAAPPPIAN